MTEFTTVDYQPHSYFVSVPIDPEEPEAGNTQQQLPCRIRLTKYWKSTDNPYEPTLHREGNEPAIVTEIVGWEDDEVIALVGHMFLVDGNPYRTDGPTTVDGDEDLLAQYEYEGYPQDEVLQKLYAQGLISEEDFNEGVEKYNSLPRIATRDEYDPDAGLYNTNGDLPFKDDVAFIVGVLDGAKP